jgi:hypothetical protein
MSKAKKKPGVNGSEVLQYLTENPGRSIYIVKGSSILGELRWNGTPNSVDYTSGMNTDQNGDPLTREIPFSKLSYIDEYWMKTIQYKPQYYTVHGMKLMMDVWEKTGI